jgi:hypothetical protein
MLSDNYVQIGELKIINSWEGINLKTYYQIKDILNDSQYEQFDKQIKVLSILANVKEDYWNEYTIREIEDVFRQLPFLNTTPEPKSQDYYTIKGEKYKLLRTREDLKGGQFIDLSHFLKDEGLINDNIPTILAIILAKTKPLSWKKRLINRLIAKGNSRPKGRKYLESWKIRPYEPEIQKYDAGNILETANIIFENMNSVEAIGLFSFFLNSSQAYYALTLHFLDSTILESLKLSKEALEEESIVNLELRQIVRKMRSMRIFTESGIGK